MKSFKINTILVPTDFSETAEKAMNHAIGIAGRIKAKLVLVHVVELTGFTVPTEMVSMGLVNEQMIDASKANLKKLAEEIRTAHGIKTDSVCYSGIVYDNIIRAAHLCNADLIVMGTHGASGIKEWLFGSNAFSVVNNTTIPVLTINMNSGTHEFKKIVFPFNENLLTLKKIEYVISLARYFDSGILLLGFATDNSADTFKDIRKKGEELSEILNRENIANSLSVVNGKSYADEVLQFANSEHADIITVVTNRLHNVDTVFTRHDKVLVNHSEIPVLSIPVE